jgi:hypothetical protein
MGCPTCTKSAGATLFIVLVQAAAACSALAGNPASSSRMNCGAQIECLTPDGQVGRISKLPVQDPTATALIMEDDTVTCVLQEGETNFVIELPDVSVPDRFTFLNENGKARGELKISVSNQRLAPNSAAWKEVEGVIPFAHKRLFGVSLLGIEAKYVRLSFRVDKQTPIASSQPINQASDTKSVAASAAASASFSKSAFDEALNSTFSREPRSNLVLLGCIVSSVAPLR